MCANVGFVCDWQVLKLNQSGVNEVPEVCLQLPSQEFYQIPSLSIHQTPTKIQFSISEMPHARFLISRTIDCLEQINQILQHYIKEYYGEPSKKNIKYFTVNFMAQWTIWLINTWNYKLKLSIIFFNREVAECNINPFPRYLFHQ